jgi:cell wall assembly regulator SMI1
MHRVIAAWQRIDIWLARHAPASLADLRGPAATAELAAAQARMGLVFPVTVTASLRCHDGTTPAARRAGHYPLPDVPPLPVSEILAVWRAKTEIAEDFPPGEFAYCAEPWWDRQWIPWAGADGSEIVVDATPGPLRGRVGSTTDDGTADFTPAAGVGDGVGVGSGTGEGWPGLGDYLQAVADTLDHGPTVHRHAWTPYLTPDHRIWWGRPGETHPLGDPLRPAPRG